MNSLEENEELSVLEGKLVREFLRNMTTSRGFAVTELMGGLECFIENYSFSQLVIVLQKVLIRVALHISFGEDMAASVWLNMNRTTLQEKAKTLGVRATSRVYEGPSRINRNLGVVRPRICSICNKRFDGDYLEPCPKCKNDNKKMIRIDRKR